MVNENSPDTNEELFNIFDGRPKEKDYVEAF